MVGEVEEGVLKLYSNNGSPNFYELNGTYKNSSSEAGDAYATSFISALNENGYNVDSRYGTKNYGVLSVDVANYTKV